MIHDFMQIAHDPPESSFFKSDFDALIEQLDRRSAETHKPLILWGVGFGLLDFAAHCRQRGYQLRSNVTVVETGGMKGRRKEWIREALHEQLGADFGVSSVASEYGMTEMMSQAYARENGFFQSPPWMKVLIRDSTDPFTLVPDSSIGGLNIIDLANFYSCPFLATQDLGRKHSDGCFEVLGRFDHSDVRGCSLMMA